MDTDIVLCTLYKVPLRHYNRSLIITMKSYTSLMVSPVSLQQCGFLGEGETRDAQTAFKPACILWSDTTVLHMRWVSRQPFTGRRLIFIPGLIHYQRFQIPKFLYETVISFDLIYPPWRGGQSCWKKGFLQLFSQVFKNAINIKATQ